MNETPSTEAPIRQSRKPRATDLNLRVNFTHDELFNSGKTLADHIRSLKDQEDEKKSVTTRLQAKVDEVKAKITQVTNDISSGYTYKMVRCEVRYDDPTIGQKRTVRLDTNETVSIDQMNSAEMQSELALDASGVPETKPKAETDGSGVVVVPADKK